MARADRSCILDSLESRPFLARHGKKTGDLTEDEVAALNKALEAGWRSVEAGRFRSAGDVISELRSRR